MSKSKCILNINNGADNILFKSHLLNENSPTLNKDREKLFYFICIPLRIFLACLILYLSFIKNDKLQHNLTLIFAIVSFYSFIHLLLKNYSKNKFRRKRLYSG